MLNDEQSVVNALAYQKTNLNMQKEFENLAAIFFFFKQTTTRVWTLS